jgi:hypothetical protein
MRAGRLIATSLLVSLVVGVGVARAWTASYTDRALTATFSASTHHPNCKQLWPVTLTARLNGKPAHATAYYQFLFGGQLVSTQQVFGGTRRNPQNHLWSFYGRVYDDTFGPFGARAVGHELTVRAVVSAGRYTAYPGSWVVVVNARGCGP